jgi:lysophospholipase L1-like esterase
VTGKRKLLYALISVGVFFLTIELALRLTYPDITERAQELQFANPHRDQPETFLRDPVLFWKLKPSVAKKQINPAGFRGPLRPIEKPEGVYRICCLGDSCTFGLGNPPVSYEHTYPAVLENLLNNKGPHPTEVLNFGIPGYSSFQGLKLLETEVVQYQPDLVTVYFGLNDGMEAIGYPDAKQRVMARMPGWVKAPQQGLWRSALYTVLSLGMTQARRSAGTEGLLRVNQEEFQQNIAAVQALGARLGFEVLVIPAVHIGSEGELKVEPASGLVANVPVLEAFLATGRAPGELIYPPPDSVHPTAEGHRTIAEALAAELIPITTARLR